jgi:hypothetical protein
VKRSLAFLLLTCSVLCLAQAPQIKGATVYIEPQDGYEAYLTAAIVKEHIPVTVVADKEKAAYIIRSTVTQTTPGQPAVVVNNQRRSAGGYEAALAAARSASASISVVDSHTSAVVFAYSAYGNGLKGTADNL